MTVTDQGVPFKVWIHVAELLVVDDSKVMREMVVACLRAQEGLRFSHASSGLEAIEKLSFPFLGIGDGVGLDVGVGELIHGNGPVPA